MWRQGQLERLQHDPDQQAVCDRIGVHEAPLHQCRGKERKRPPDQQQMFGAMAKSYYAELEGIAPEETTGSEFETLGKYD